MKTSMTRSNSSWSLVSWSTPLLKRRRTLSSESSKRTTHRCSDEINKQDDHGRNLLFYAAIYDQPEVAIQLLDAGCDPNISDVKGRTPLHEAVRTGSLDVAKVLIQQGGCCVHAKTTDGKTALMTAVEKDDSEMVKFLLKSGSRLDDLDDLGRSALLIGLHEGSEKSILHLVKAGCDVNITDMEGHSALFYATYNTKLTSLSIARKLLKSGYKARKDADWLKEAAQSPKCLFSHDNKFFCHVLSKAGLNPKQTKPELVKTLKITYFHKIFHMRSS